MPGNAKMVPPKWFCVSHWRLHVSRPGPPRLLDLGKKTGFLLTQHNGGKHTKYWSDTTSPGSIIVLCQRRLAPSRGPFRSPLPPPPGVHCFASFLLFASSQECGVAEVGSDTYMRLKTARLRRAPEKEAQRHNTKEGPLWEARLVWAGQKRGRHLGTWEEKRGASKGSRVPYTDKTSGFF